MKIYLTGGGDWAVLFPQQQLKQPLFTSLFVGEGGYDVECLLFFVIPTPLKGKSISTNSRS